MADFGVLSPAEKKVLAAVRMGKEAAIGSARPTAETAGNMVRGDFIRFLLLGGDDSAPVHEDGVRVCGAWIKGEISLRYAKVCSLRFRNCVLDSKLKLGDSEIAGVLFLPGTSVPCIYAPRMRCIGSVFLKDGFKATGGVAIRNARIGGSINIKDAQFSAGGDDLAIDAGGIVVERDVSFLAGVQVVGAVDLGFSKIAGTIKCQEASFKSNHEFALSLDGAAIGGDLRFDDSTIEGELRLIGARIEGDLSLSKARLKCDLDCLSMDRARIGGDAYLLDMKTVGSIGGRGLEVAGDMSFVGAEISCDEATSINFEGVAIGRALMFHSLANPVSNINLGLAKIGAIVDDVVSWGGGTVLDGLSYGRFSGRASTRASDRIEWLKGQKAEHVGTSFRPQPWRELQRVLRESGHVEDSRQVAIELEHSKRNVGLIGATPESWAAPRRWMYRSASRFGHWMLWVLVGYGYRPVRLFAWMLGIWLAFGGYYFLMAERGVFAPADPLVFQNQDYKSCWLDGSKERANWYGCAALRDEYPGLSPLAYSLDVLLPVVNLRQEEAWGAKVPTPLSPWYRELFALDSYRLTRLAIWLQTIFGWVATLLLVAFLTGLLKRDEQAS
ncbi:hypothetical protein [Pseudomonas sp. CGJS7]|uniref:hypothetical protein n=1 Tax=Pseudomonas sp. CGJS7 TaxID=3109348 RepID=UPI00300A2205